MIVNLYVPNVSKTDFIEYRLLYFKAQINPNTIIVGDFITPVLPKDRSSRPEKKKKNKETSELNDTIDQMDITDIHRMLH
jgi:hypothetical protein